jgi:hypothetical protein
MLDCSDDIPAKKLIDDIEEINEKARRSGLFCAGAV